MRTPVLLVAGLMLLTACPRKEEPRPPHAAAAVDAPPPSTPPVREAPQKAKPAEIEFFGSVAPGKTKPAKIFFFASQEPCIPVPAEVHLFGKTELTQEKLFAEYWPPQGSQAHLCAYGLDASGRVMAAAAFGKNPVTLQGEGDVLLSHIDLTLESLPEPVAAPKGM